MAPRGPFTVFGQIFPRSGGGTGLPAVSASADGKTYTSGSGLKPGSTAVLYANGTQVATATVSGSGIAIWTLSNAAVAGATMTYDGVITGSAGTAPTQGGGTVTLNTLSLAPNSATVGTAYSGTVSGNTSGSSLALSGAGASGLSVSGSSVTGTPTTAGSVDLVETLAGATNTPRTSSGVLTVNAAAVTLNALSLAPSTATAGTTYSGTISNATAGSTITLSGAGSSGLSVSGTGTTRTLSGTPTTAGSVNLIETLSGATNSPRTTSGLLTVSAAANVTDPNVTAINADGWSAQDSAANQLNPSNRNVVASRQGFDTSGASTTYTESFPLTQRVRQPYPNQASLDSSGRTALSDYIYSTDTISGTTNNSGEVSPKPIALWARAPNRVAGNTLPRDWLEIVAAHRNARGGEEIACVIWTISDGTNTVTVTRSVSEVSGHAGDRNAVLVYRPAADVDITSLAAGAITVNAKVYPWIGGAASVADSSTSTVAREFSPRTFLKNVGKATSPPYAYVATTGNDSTGVVSTTATTAKATPFLTVQGAIAGLKAATAVTGGLVDGCIIRLGANTAGMSAASAAGTYQATGELIIERDPDVARADATWPVGATLYGTRCTYIRLRDLTIKRTGTAAVVGLSVASGNAHAVLENCDFDNGSQNASWLPATAGVGGYMLGVTITNGASSALNASANPDNRLVRGVSYGTAGTSLPVEGWCVLGCAMTTAYIVAGTRTQSGSIVAFNRGLIAPSANSVWSVGQAENINGAALLQNVFESAHTTTSTPAVGASRDSATGSNTHVVIHHNTFVGANILGRSNLFYEDGTTARTSKLMSVVGNLHTQINTKGDVFVQDGARVGNWSYLYGAGCAGEFSMYVDAGPNDPSFRQAYPGLNAKIGTSTTTRQDPLFVDYKGTTYNGTTYTAGAGNGNYDLQSGSPAAGMVPRAPLSFDLLGRSRPLNNAAAGAYRAPLA